MLALLARQGIMVRTAADNGQVAFNQLFANNQLSSKIIVKIQLTGFERVSQLLADLNQHAISYADPNHYLFRFSAV